MLFFLGCGPDYAARFLRIRNRRVKLLIKIFVWARNPRSIAIGVIEGCIGFSAEIPA